MFHFFTSSVVCYGARFTVRTITPRFRRKLRTVISHDGNVVATIENSHRGRAHSQVDVKHALGEQHRRLVAELRAGRLLLSKPGAEQPAFQLQPRLSRLLHSACRGMADCCVIRWTFAVSVRSTRVTVLAWCFAVSSLASAGLSVQTEVGLSESTDVAVGSTTSRAVAVEQRLPK